MAPAQLRSLPVLMHHYISNYKNTIAVSPHLFDDHCKLLAEKGWRGISLAEAEAFFLHSEPLPPRSFLYTFDDGYLDNYLFALPIMKKYGHNGVMFAVTNRLEAGTAPRATLDSLFSGAIPDMPELHDPVRPNELGYMTRNDVFCSHAEVQCMDAEGTLAVAGHSRAHLGVFINDSYTDFIQPTNQGRTFYLTSYGTIWGLPKFPVKPGLANRAFLPSEDLITAITSLVPQGIHEADEFFKTPSAVQQLHRLVLTFAGKMGRMETDAEMNARMWLEIDTGKKELEAILGHSIQTLCWPWGQFSAEALRLGQDAGYKVFLTTQAGPNKPGDALAVHRFKVKAKPADWVLSRVKLYSSPLLAKLYSLIRK